MLNYFGVANDLTWTTKDPDDNVNPTLFYYVVKDKRNYIHKFKYLCELKTEIELRLEKIFGNTKFKLWQCFIQKYSKDMSHGNKRSCGALMKHLDGDARSRDVAAVVYTLHLGISNTYHSSLFIFIIVSM